MAAALHAVSRVVGLGRHRHQIPDQAERGHQAQHVVADVDLPPEEVDRLDQALIRVGIDNILLISPTTERERVQKIVARARGFIYYVAVKGVTGSGRLDVSEVAERVGMIRELTALPVAVGFGIKDAESAAQIAEVADAVVVGSALIDEMVKKSQADAGSEEIQIHQAAVQLLERIRAGVDSSRF
ncbi:MAG: geranylgeranylglyceryl/heptaprenylglyceryl phosphate synthase [Luminiphilus sp.]